MLVQALYLQHFNNTHEDSSYIMTMTCIQIITHKMKMFYINFYKTSFYSYL